MTKRIVVLPEECVLLKRFIKAGQSQQILQRLNRDIAWQQHKVKVFNREYRVPRLTAWYGDKGIYYRYSGTTHCPLPWIPILTELRYKLEHFLVQPFNSVLLNLYRNGEDAMGRHSDDEKELGPEPVIASLSFGGTRKLAFHPRSGNAEPSAKIDLEDGSLLVMQGTCQTRWKHSVPRIRRATEPRINLTFRNIVKPICA